MKGVVEGEKRVVEFAHSGGAGEVVLNFGDCVPGMGELAEGSVDLCVSSIPFGSLFMYSGKREDIGNNHDGTDLKAGQFGLHMRFWAAEVFRVMRPGRNVCIHIQQLLRYKNEHGWIGRRDFRGSVVELMMEAGFHWKGEWVIPKNPQVIAKRLNLHCLMFATGKRNAADLAPAVNDYVLVFQRPGGEGEVPVRALYDGVQNPDGWVSTEEWIRDAYGVLFWDDLKLKGREPVPGLGRYYEENFGLEGYEESVRWWLENVHLESGVWDDIQETDVLDGWKSARESDEEKHVCPLQLEVIRRCVRLYTNAGEVVMDPFMGIGSVGYVCVELGRNCVGWELKESYFDLSWRNVRKGVGGMRVRENDLVDLLTGDELGTG